MLSEVLISRFLSLPRWWYRSQNTDRYISSRLQLVDIMVGEKSSLAILFLVIAGIATKMVFPRCWRVLQSSTLRVKLNSGLIRVNQQCSVGWGDGGRRRCSEEEGAFVPRMHLHRWPGAANAEFQFWPQRSIDKSVACSSELSSTTSAGCLVFTFYIAEKVSSRPEVLFRSVLCIWPDKVAKRLGAKLKSFPNAPNVSGATWFEAFYLSGVQMPSTFAWILSIWQLV